MRTFPAWPTRASSSRSNSPGFNVDVDRTRAQYVGVTERDVTNSMVVNLAGSSQVAPTYWLNPDNGVSYPIVMQTPQYQIDSLIALKNLPITASGRAVADARRDRRHQSRRAERGRLAIQHPAHDPDLRDHAGRDLGAVAADVQKVVDEIGEGRAEGRAGRRCSARSAR